MQKHVRLAVSFLAGFLAIPFMLWADTPVNDAKDLSASGLQITGGVDTGVSGRVTGPDEEPLEGIEVAVLRWYFYGGEWIDAYTHTDANGNYAITGLDEGTYILQFKDPEGNFAFKFYENAVEQYSAERFYVEDGEIVTGKNVALELGGRISGRVTNTNGTPLEDIEVGALLWDGYDWQFTGFTAVTDANGQYVIAGLPAETYLLSFWDETTIYAGGFYDNALHESSATPIVITPGSVFTEKNAVLEKAGQIAGTVFAFTQDIMFSALVIAYRWNGDDWVEAARMTPELDGDYTIPGLPAGTYRVEFRSWFNNYSEFYDAAQDLESATDITVIAGETTYDIDGTLGGSPDMGAISGKVTGPNGITPLNNIKVVAYQLQDNETWRWMTQVTTGESGRYIFRELPPGDYRLGFFNSYYDEIFIEEYYDDVEDFEDATDIRVVAGETTVNINASLAVSSNLGSISGKVTGADGVTPLRDIMIKVYHVYPEGWSSDYSWRTLTDANGEYASYGLEPGTYCIEFVDPHGFYGSKFYENAYSVFDGTEIDVLAGQVATGINASLVPGRKISGRVTDQDGITPLPEISVELLRWHENWEEWEWIFLDTYTNEDGEYTISGLPPGTYTLGFYDYGQIYSPQFLGGVASPYRADKVHLGDVENVTGVNAALLKAGEISGRVTDTDGAGIEDILVLLFLQESGEWLDINGCRSDEDGYYSIEGIHPGTYRIMFFSTDELYAEQYYKKAFGIESASDIVVVSGQTVPDINGSLYLFGADPYTIWANGINWQGQPDSPDADADGDGFTNDQERIAGTDPLSAADYFRATMAGFTADGEGFVLGTALPGRLYTVRRAAELPLPWSDWTPVAVTIENGQIIAPVDPAAASAFFRLKVEME